MRLDNLLQESINDKYKFKAVFFAGFPGSGKSKLIDRMGTEFLGVKLVDPDKYVELQMSKGTDPDTISKDEYRKIAKAPQVGQIVNYVNGMLPMYVATTGANYNSTIRRAEILESFGYDTMMVYVDSDFWDVLENIERRKRVIAGDFIDMSFKTIIDHLDKYKQFFGKNFYIHQNTFMREDELEEYIELKDREDELEGQEVARLDMLEEKMYKAQRSEMDLPELKHAVERFFRSPPKNAKAKSTISYLERTNGKYLTDGVMELDRMRRILQNW